jgi:hypothetical protein
MHQQHQQVGYQHQSTFIQQPMHVVVNQQGIPIYPQQQQYLQYQQGPPPQVYQQRGGQYVQVTPPPRVYNQRGSPINNNSPQQVGMQPGVVPLQYMNHPQYMNPQMTEKQHSMMLRQQQVQGSPIYIQQPMLAPPVTTGQIPIGPDGQPIVVVPQQLLVQQPPKPVDELVVPPRKKVIIKDKDGNPIDLNSYKKEVIPTTEITVAVNKSIDNLSLSTTIPTPSISTIPSEEINSTTNNKIEIQNNIQTEVNIEKLPPPPPVFAVSTQPQFPVKVSPIPPSPPQVTPVIPKPEFKVHVTPTPVFGVHVCYYFYFILLTVSYHLITFILFSLLGTSFIKRN